MSWLVLIDHLAQLIFLFPFSSVQHVKAFRFQLGLLCQIISDALNVELGGGGQWFGPLGGLLVCPSFLQA